jgi:hypothetical protein
MYDITIIGYGITGMLTLAILQQNFFDLSKVCVIDPYYDGGTLMREYGNVISNTPLSKLITALQSIKPEYAIPEEYCSYDVNKITPLYVLTNIIKDFTKNIFGEFKMNKQPKKVEKTESTLDYGKIQKMIESAVNKALKENGLLVESTEKSNENFTFRVGKHIFEGKVTKIKKIS